MARATAWERLYLSWLLRASAIPGTSTAPPARLAWLLLVGDASGLRDAGAVDRAG
jgi:hypothetical protein